MEFDHTLLWQNFHLCVIMMSVYNIISSLVAQMVKNLPAMWETWVQSLGREDPPGEGNGLSLTPLFLPGELHGQRSLAGYCAWGHKELDMTEQLILSLCFSPQCSRIPT